VVAVEISPRESAALHQVTKVLGRTATALKRSYIKYYVYSDQLLAVFMSGVLMRFPPTWQRLH